METTATSIPNVSQIRYLLFSPMGRRVTRGWMVALTARGWSRSEVAEVFECHPRTVRRWDQRYREDGVAGLEDRPGRGRRPKLTRAMKSQLEQWLQAATSGAAEAFTFWTVVRLTVELTTTFGVQLSEATIRRTLHRLDYVWRRPRLCAAADDPAKEQRLQEIAATLEKGKEGELVFYQDETTVRLLPLIRSMWMKVGQQLRVTVPANWNRAFSVFLALNPLTGAFVYELLERHNGQAFLTFLEKLVATYPGQAIHLILDNARYHNCHLVQEWLNLHPQVHPVWLPKRSPQLNPVEDLWRWLKPAIAANRTHHDLEPLRQACRAELNALTPEQALRKAGLLGGKGGQNL